MGLTHPVEQEPLTMGRSMNVWVLEERSERDEGRVTPIRKKTTTIGRSHENDIVLNHGSVSRSHAKLKIRPDGLLLIDENSRNGTRVQGIAVVRRVLQDGDRISFGEIEVVCHEIEDSDSFPDIPPDEELPSASDDEPFTRATTTQKELSTSDIEVLKIIQTEHFTRMFTNGSHLCVEDSLRSVAKELSDLRDVRQVILYLRSSVLNKKTQKFIAGKKSKVLGTRFPEANLVRVAKEDAPLGLSGSKLVPVSTGLEFEAVCLPIHAGDHTQGSLYLEGEEILPPDVIEVAGAALSAITTVLSIWAKAGSSVVSQPIRSSNALAIVGNSKPLHQTIQLAEKAARSDSTVLIRGETGTGKELLARLIVSESKRTSSRFTAIHCAAINDELLGSTLFGHEKGAFTGAIGRKRGVFEEVDKGTIFLDEVGELSQPVQTQLLRVIQEKEFMRLGGTQPIHVDVRLIAATNRNLEQAVREGLFREDLYYRLRVIEITLPPLRERRDDIADLVQHFIRDLGTTVQEVSFEAMKILVNYAWPGNIRELRNVIERASVLAERSQLGVQDLPPELLETKHAIRAENAEQAFQDSSDRLRLASVEKEHILNVLDTCGGNKSLAAKKLDISRGTLHQKLKLFGDTE